MADFEQFDDDKFERFGGGQPSFENFDEPARSGLETIKEFYKPLTEPVTEHVLKPAYNWYKENATKPTRDLLEKYVPTIEEKMMKGGSLPMALVGKELNWLRTSPNARPVRAGLNKSLVGEAVKALTDKPLYENFNILGEDRKVEAPGEYTPQSLGGKIVKGGAEMAADLPLYAAGGELAAPVKAGIAAESVPKLLKPIQWAAKHAAGGATMFGATEAIKSPVTQLAETGKIDLDKWVEDTAEGIKTGAIAEPAFVGVAKGLGLPVKYVARALRNKLIEKGFALSDKQLAAMAEAEVAGEKEIKEFQKQAKMLKKIEKLDRQASRAESKMKPEVLDATVKPTKTSEITTDIKPNERVQTKGISANELDAATELNSINQQREELLNKVRNLKAYKQYAKSGMSDREILDAMHENLPLKTTGGAKFDFTRKLDRQEYAQYIYKDAAKKNGIITYDVDPITGEPLDKEIPKLKTGSSFMQKMMLNAGELFDATERKLGVKMGHIPSKLTEISNGGKNRTKAYIDFLSKTTTVDGKRLKTLLLGEAAPENDIELAAVKEARGLLNGIHKELVSQGMLREAQFIEQYVPREGVPGVKRGADVAVKGGRVNLKERLQSFQHERTAELERLGAEKDAHKIIGHYIAKVERGIMLKQALPDIQKASWQLRALGHVGKARELEKYAERALGLEPSGKMTIFEAELANGTSDEIMNILKFAGVPERDLTKSVYNHILEMNYNALIGMNPKMLFYEQPMQGRIYGDIEMGHKWNAVGENVRAELARMLNLPLAEYKWLGRGGSKALPREFVEALNRNYKRLLGPELEPLEQFGGIDPNKLPDKWERIFKVANFGSKHGMERFQKLEHLNRAATFISGFNKFNTLAKSGDRAGMEEAMSTFNTSQRRQVEELIAKGDMLGAADRFGLTMSNRVHFLYSAFDKPLYLQEGIGSLIPFTTWSRNQFARMLTDYSHGDSKQMIKRLVIPILYAKAMEYGTGLKPKGQSGLQIAQASSGMALMTPAIAPTLGAFAKDVSTGKWGSLPKDIAGTIPITKPIPMTMELFKKNNPGFGGFNYNKYNLLNAIITGGAVGIDKMTNTPEFESFDTETEFEKFD